MRFKKDEKKVSKKTSNDTQPIKSVNKKTNTDNKSTEKKKKGIKILKKNMTAMVVIFVLMFVSLIGYTSYSMAVYGQKWFASPYNTRAKHQKDKIDPGQIKDTNGLVMASSDENGNRVYPQSESARYANAHILGDPYGITAGGAEAIFSRYIYGFNLNTMDRIFQAFKAEKNKGNDITLTIDSDLNKYIYEQMGKNTGAVVVSNYKTGEIIGSVSKESFDISKIQEIVKQPVQEGSSIFLNKATSGKYPPGSSFKIITAVSALENLDNAQSITYDSPSYITINGERITNYGSSSHGTIDLNKAIEVSSNTYFAQLAKEIGKSNLTKTAEKFGFNENFMFDDLLIAQSSYTAGKTDNELGWSAVGQYKDLATPIHMNMVISAIANDGVMMEPKTLKNVTDSLGNTIYSISPKKYRQVTSKENAQIMQGMLENAVEKGTGKSAKVKGLTIGGKTGSAETGKETHAWFVGYINDDKYPYAVSIILEGAGTGGSKAAPIANKIFTYLTK